MIDYASSTYEGEGYNPLKCWNEQDPELHVNMLVRALVRINVEIDLSDNSKLGKYREWIVRDAFLDNKMLQKICNI